MNTPTARRRIRPGIDVPDPVPDPPIPPDFTDEPLEDEEGNELPEVERHQNGTVTSNGARALVQARWLTEAASREDLVSFFNDCSIEEGLAHLARMREMCELAARTIEKRRTEETQNTACCICGVTRRKLGNRNWRMVAPRKDAKTQTIFTDYYCSDACVVEGNRRKYGMAAMQDRGMLPGDAPDTAKNSIIAHQAKVKAEHEMAELSRKMQKGK